MKELLHNILAFALVCVIATLLGSCHVEENKYEGPQVNKPVKVADFFFPNEEIRKLEFEGHEYIIYRSNQLGGIVHSESCPNPVHEKKQEEKKDDYLGW